MNEKRYDNLMCLCKKFIQKIDRYVHKVASLPIYLTYYLNELLMTNKKPLNKNAVVTLSLNYGAKRIGALTHPLMKNYAKKIKADFVIINKPKIFLGAPHFEKYQIKDLLDKYDRILYMDTDILVKSDCPNLFKIVPRKKIGALVEDKIESRIEELKRIQRKLGYIGWKKEYINTGVLVLSSEHKNIFDTNLGIERTFINSKKPIGEQTQLNYNIKKLKIPVFDISLLYNHVVGLNGYKSNIIFCNRFNSYIIHYAGSEYYTKDRMILIKSDFKKLLEPNFI